VEKSGEHSGEKKVTLRPSARKGSSIEIAPRKGPELAAMYRSEKDREKETGQ